MAHWRSAQNASIGTPRATDTGSHRHRGEPFPTWFTRSFRLPDRRVLNRSVSPSVMSPLNCGRKGPKRFSPSEPRAEFSLCTVVRFPGRSPLGSRFRPFAADPEFKLLRVASEPRSSETEPAWVAPPRRVQDFWPDGSLNRTAQPAAREMSRGLNQPISSHFYPNWLQRQDSNL